MERFSTIGATLLDTALDVLPIIAILLFFQLVALRRSPANPRRIAIGFVYTVVGLALFLVGLEQALFPLGEIMARELTQRVFSEAASAAPDWSDYFWVYAFAFAIGFSTTVAEPSLIAVAIKAREVSGGTLNALGLRLAVALGVAAGVALGSFRIITGAALPWYIIAGYGVVIVQTLFAPRAIVPLAYDSGGVTTSTVTVPLVAALGLGLANAIPGRSVLIDGFGLIAFASLFPIMTVMGYAQIVAWREGRAERGRPKEE